MFNDLPKDYQTVLVEECEKAGEETSNRIFKLEAEVKEQLKGRGMTWSTASISPRSARPARRLTRCSSSPT